MTEGKHTPGEWITGEEAELATPRQIFSVAFEKGIFDGLNYDERCEMWEANARLIKAAPGLLAACEGLCADGAGVHSRWVSGLGTINECPYCHRDARDTERVVHADNCPIRQGATAIAKAKGEN